jgi:hypothetical protein
MSRMTHMCLGEPKMSIKPHLYVPEIKQAYKWC